MAEDVGEGATMRLVDKEIGRDRRGPIKGTTGPGPIRTLVSQISFRRAHLITNYSTAVSRAFKAWLGGNAELHEVQLQDPTSYGEVFGVASMVFGEVWRTLDRNERLCVHLSPGTATMAAVSVLLAKTRFPATLYQTNLGEVREEDVPFDIYFDYFPELLREPYSSLQALAARSPMEVEGFESILGNSQAIKLAVGRAQRAAIPDVNILITGESGTGKEMFARAIHAASPEARRIRNVFAP